MRRVLLECVSVPDSRLVTELERNSIESASDLVCLQQRTVDGLRNMSDAPKMKLHHLVELIVKDPTIDRIVINTVECVGG